MKIEFNINDNVQVKLTDYGRECLKKNYDTLFSYYGKNKPFPFKLPEEDKDGYSTWQMWELMQQFGPYLSMGIKNPFELTIKIEIK